MIRIEDGGPAFPVEVSAGADGYLVGRQTGSQSGYATGISIRDYFAAKAMQIMWDAYHEGYCGLTNHDTPSNDVIAEGAYQLADAMLAERAK